MENRRTVVIGFDGADKQALIKGISNGSLQNFAKIASEGGISTLRTTYPPITPVSASSILTGVTPARHGVFGFEKDPKNGGGYHDYTSIQADTLYDILDSEDRDFVSINVPMTSPVPNKGLVISGFPQASNKISNRKDVNYRLKKADYRVEPKDRGTDESEFIEDVMDLAEKRFEAAKMLEDEEWDLFFLMFTGDARLQHFIDDDQVISKFYQRADRYIGELLEEFGDVNIVILSTHGFTRLEHELDIGTWLEDNGYMESRGSNWDGIYGRIEPIDSAKAYPGGAYMGNIYADQDIIEDVVKGLEELEHNGNEVFRDVYLSEELYGPSNGPEIIPVPRRKYNYVVKGGPLFSSDTDEAKVPDTEGVILTNRPDLDLSDASVTDILPTLTSLLGVKTPEDIDGISLLKNPE